MVGRYTFFERILIVFVTIMGVSFIISMFVVLPSPREIVSGLLPGIPDVPGANMMVAAFVGTTMAAPTFIVRPLLMRGKGWGSNQVREQSRDSLISATLMFIISGSIMAAATGALYQTGQGIEKVLDMVYTLEPVAGKFAVFLFLFGTISARLSSILPILMVCPLLIADYKDGALDTSSRQFKILAGIACCFGLTVSIFGANPIVAQIATQVAQVFILPIVIVGIAYLVNQEQLMREHRAGFFLNIGLTASLFFALIISYRGILALSDFFGGS
jgi:Mn2+/Fe2+ NRAMP family transporter